MAGYHQYKSCIDACLQCAALCYAAAQLMSMGNEQVKEICRICAALCEACGAECGKHKTEHCQECAEACRKCAEECNKMAA